MHYCLSSQVNKEYLKKADEIKIKYNQLNSIIDLYEINPKATIVLAISDSQVIDWDTIEKYNTML